MNALSRPPVRPVALESSAVPSGAAGDGLAAAGKAALKLHAAVLGCADLPAVTRTAVRELALLHGLRRVSVSLVPPLQPLVLRLWAASDGQSWEGGQGGTQVSFVDPAPAHADPGPVTGSAQRALQAAHEEVLDQAARVVWPTPSRRRAGPVKTAAAEPAREVPRLNRALRALAQSSGAQAAVGLPLVVQGAVIGVLCVEADAPLSAAALAELDHQTVLLAPVLALWQDKSLPWYRQLQRQARAAWQQRTAPLGRARTAWLGGAGLLLCTAALWPVTVPVGGQARLEGAVQRVLSVPSDGFLQQVYARPGDSVTAGQVLVDLADRELQLERQRWESQLAQHEDAYATANARADRAQLVQNRSKADEARAQLELVESQLERARLVAPFDGLVVQGDLSQRLGAPVRQGDELLTLVPHDRFRVIVEVEEHDIARVQRGQAGTVVLSALPWQSWPLRVVRVTPTAHAVEGRNVFDVEAEFLSTGTALSAQGVRPGLQGSAQIGTGQAPWLWRWLRRGVDAVRLRWWAWWG